MDPSTDTSQIGEWHSIITLVVFVLVNVAVLFPFHIPIPLAFRNVMLDGLSKVRILPPRQQWVDDAAAGAAGKKKLLSRFPINFVTAPLIGDLFLLAMSAIGRDEVHDGTVGANNISPIEIMAFFFTLAYIAISIDASGLIRYLAFKVVDKKGEFGHELFCYLYAFFFIVGSFIGNDPIVLSGTAFLAYMTRISSNIRLPTAWIYSQFAVANTASAILVSSNPTNLVLAGAFSIRFVDYTANMIVPVVITSIILLPFLLYIVFNDASLIPYSIKMQKLPDELKERRPVNPNIPDARGSDLEKEAMTEKAKVDLLSLEEVMNPFLDKKGAWFGAVIMATALIVILVVNATAQSEGEKPVFYVTLPAAFVMFCWDLLQGWLGRHETREIARKGREQIVQARAERAYMERCKQEGLRIDPKQEPLDDNSKTPESPSTGKDDSIVDTSAIEDDACAVDDPSNKSRESLDGQLHPETPCRKTNQSTELDAIKEVEVNTAKIERDGGRGHVLEHVDLTKTPSVASGASSKPERNGTQGDKEAKLNDVSNEEDLTGVERVITDVIIDQPRGPQSLASLLARGYRWSQETFPTVMAVLAHLPFPLVPFALAMFVLVQALVTKGWVNVFAYGWDHWVTQTGNIGAIGGMGFLSVILCNFAGTNIGTTILLTRVIQQWIRIRKGEGIFISDRMFWGTVYSMALGVNFGAYSTALSASLAGLLWRDILGRKHIHVPQSEFARVNLPIIAVAMAVGCTVLVGEIYIKRTELPCPLPNV